MKKIGYIDGRRAFFDDTWDLSIGRSKDIAMNWDGTRFNVTQLTADSEIRWGVSGAGIDQRWYGDTVGSYMLWDQSANSLTLAGVATLVVAGGVNFLGNLNVQGDVGIAQSLTVIGNCAFKGATVGVDHSVTIGENLVIGGNIECSGSLRIVLTSRFDSDITIMGSSSTHAVFWHSASDLWAFGMDDHGINVNFYAEATGHGVFWDEDGDTNNGVWSFGATSKGSDVVFWGNTDLYRTWWNMDGDTNGQWLFGDDAKGVMVTFNGATTGHLVQWDPDGDTNGEWSFGASTKGVMVKFYGAVANFITTFDPNDDTNGSWAFGADTYGVKVEFYAITTGCGVFWDPDGDTNHGTWSFGATGGSKGTEVFFYGATTGFYVHWDQDGSTNGAWHFGADTKGVYVSFYSIVTGGGVFWAPDGDTNAGEWSFGASGGAKGVDVYFYGNTTGASVLWDQSADEFVFAKASIDMGGTLPLQGIDEPYIAIGTNTTPIEITLADHVLGIGVYLEAVNSNAHSLIAGYFKVKTDGAHAATLTQLVGTRPRVIIDQDISSAYGCQSTMDVSGTTAIAQEASAGSYYLDATGTLTTAVRLNALMAMVSGTASVTVTDTVAGGYDVAWFGASANADVDSIVHLYAHDTSSPTQAMLIHTISTTAMNGIIFTEGGSGVYATLFEGNSTLTVADQAMHLTITETGTHASGVKGIQVQMTKMSGAITGAGEFVGIASEIQLRANASNSYAFNAYTGVSGTPTLGYMSAYHCYCDDLGAAHGNVNYYGCADLNIDSTNEAAGFNYFIRMYAHGGPPHTAFYFPSSVGIDQLIYFEQTADPVEAQAVPGDQAARIKVLFGVTQYYLPLYK